MAPYGMTTTLQGSRDVVREKVEAALKTEGFGILTRIDMRGTLKDKIGVEIEPYEILGACNPGFASKALEVDRSIGLLLPCNVVLRDVGGDVDGAIEVSILDPEVIFSVADTDVQEGLREIVTDVKARLNRVLAVIGRG